MPAAVPRPRRLAVALAVLGASLLVATTLSLPAPAAGATVSHPHKMLGAIPHARATQGFATRAAQPAAGNLIYGGGPVLHSNTTYAIFWDPAGRLSPSYRAVIAKYFADVAADSGKTSNSYGVHAQYHDSGGAAAYASSFGGAVIDTNPYPSGCPIASGYTACFNDTQLAAEVRTVLSAQHWPTGLQPIFFVFTPSGIDSCFDSAGSSCASKTFCGYHSDTIMSGSEVLYADQPYAEVSGCTARQYPNADPADATLDTVSHEHIETVTDPLGNAWADLSGNEIGDKCSHQFGAALGGTVGAGYNEVINGSRYYTQQEWSNLAGGCIQRPAGQAIISASSGQTGTPLVFDGSASAGLNGPASGHSWSFGDGASAVGARATHMFSAAGSYTARLTIDDGAGGSASATATVAAAGAPPPVNDFALALSPSSSTVTAGSSLQTRVSATVASGASEIVALNASGLPAGAGAWFTPVAVSSGGSSTLAIVTSPWTPAGTYSVSVTGNDGQHTHAATLSLTVKATGSGGGGGGGCTDAQLLGNPGFETGSAAPWIAPAGVISSSGGGQRAHAGGWLAWLGGYGSAHTDVLAQRTTMPAGCANATLSFWLHIDTAEHARSGARDTLRVVLVDRAGVAHRLATFSNLSAAAGYQQHSYDVSQYRGQKVTIEFVGTEDGARQTSFVIDDTALVTDSSSARAHPARNQPPRKRSTRRKR